MAFIRSPDNISIEILQDGDAFIELKNLGNQWKILVLGRLPRH